MATTTVFAVPDGRVMVFDTDYDSLLVGWELIEALREDPVTLGLCVAVRVA